MECDNVNPKSSVVCSVWNWAKKAAAASAAAIIEKQSGQTWSDTSLHITCPFAVVSLSEAEKNEILLGSMLFIVSEDFAAIFLLHF